MPADNPLEATQQARRLSHSVALPARAHSRPAETLCAVPVAEGIQLRSPHRKLCAARAAAPHGTCPAARGGAGAGTAASG